MPRHLAAGTRARPESSLLGEEHAEGVDADAGGAERGEEDEDGATDDGRSSSAAAGGGAAAAATAGGAASASRRDAALEAAARAATMAREGAEDEELAEMRQRRAERTRQALSEYGDFLRLAEARMQTQLGERVESVGQALRERRAAAVERSHQRVDEAGHTHSARLRLLEAGRNPFEPAATPPVPSDERLR